MMNSENKGLSPYKLQVGRCYTLASTAKSVVSFASRGSYSSFESACTFRYEGKKGIHHFFREIVGDWLRTFTNAQFVGRTIQEVEA